MSEDSQKKNPFWSLWPIHADELPKFLPMAGIMFCLLMNYSMLRSIKDTLCVVGIGPESLGFLKTYFVLPSAVIFTIFYAWLCNKFTPKKVYYIISSMFAIYFALFAFILYPNQDLFHISTENTSKYMELYPHAKWFIKIFANWTYAIFYIMSELWGGVGIHLLFWQFANQTTQTSEAKRQYPMYGILGNFGLIATGFLIGNIIANAESGNIGAILPVPCFVTATMMFFYYTANKAIERMDTAAGKKPKKKKLKLSLVDSFKLILSSKYLGLIATLVITYGISLVLIEGVWKAKVNELYPGDPNGYLLFMGEFQKCQGIGAIAIALLGGMILRKCSWLFAAALTPMIGIVTGSIFFGIIFFEKHVAHVLSAILMLKPLMFLALLGAAQNIMLKATKYSLFDGTKEMTYIPLDDELKSKGKAAVDVVGGRLGKSGGGIILSSIFMFMPDITFGQATPYLGMIAMVIFVIWLIAVAALNVEYKNKLEGNKQEV